MFTAIRRYASVVMTFLIFSATWLFWIFLENLTLCGKQMYGIGQCPEWPWGSKEEMPSKHPLMNRVKDYRLGSGYKKEKSRR